MFSWQVYGALPPESRAHQAKLFNTMRTGFNVLVASDAVGMGLNLNIRCAYSSVHLPLPRGLPEQPAEEGEAPGVYSPATPTALLNAGAGNRNQVPGR